jgi:hypothetical protein
MANTIVLSQTGVGSTVWTMPDWRQVPFALGLTVGVSGTVNYTVQDTPEDIMVTAVPTVINAHPTLAALAVQATGNYAFPVKGIRLTVNSGTGTATLYINQGENA